MPSENLKEQLRSLRIERTAAEPMAPLPRRRRRRAGWIVSAAIVFALLGYAVYRWSSGAPLRVHGAYARRVQGGQAIVGPLLSGAGYLITAEKYIAIGVRVPGRIERFFVDEGDHVETGQMLVQLDDRDYRAQVGRAEAALRLAQANRRLAEADRARIRTLFHEGVASRQELDQAESRADVAAASVAQAENEVALARTNFDDTKLRSPVRGVVLAKLKGVGEIAVPGGFAGSGDLLRLADLSELRAEVDVSEADLANVRLGQDAEVVPDAYPQKRFGGKVVKLYPQVNRQKGTLKVEVRIGDPDASLLPDMGVRVTFFATPPSTTVEGKPSVVVPRAAIRRGPNGAYVWSVVHDHLAKRAVEVAQDVGDETVVAHGLDGGELVVVNPEGGLREGRTVSVEE
jgi:RND family efflux transporter MFP subunit